MISLSSCVCRALYKHVYCLCGFGLECVQEVVHCTLDVLSCPEPSSLFLGLAPLCPTGTRGPLSGLRHPPGPWCPPPAVIGSWAPVTTFRDARDTHSSVTESAPDAVIKMPLTGGFNSRHLRLSVLEAGSLRSRHQTGQALARAAECHLPLLHPRVSETEIVFLVSSYKGTSLIRGFTLMTTGSCDGSDAVTLVLRCGHKNLGRMRTFIPQHPLTWALFPACWPHLAPPAGGHQPAFLGVLSFPSMAE